MYLVNINSKTAVRSCIDKLYVSETMIKFHVSSQDFCCLSRAETGWFYRLPWVDSLKLAATGELVRFSIIHLSVKMALFRVKRN